MSEQTEGVPLGMRIKRIGKAKRGEWALSSAHGELFRADPSSGEETVLTFPVLEPDNVYGKPLEEVPVPEGYEYDGTKPEEWWRVPKSNDQVLLRSGSLYCFSGNAAVDRWICIRPIKRTKRVLVIECDEPPEAPCKVSVCTMDNLQVMFYAKVNYFGIEEREA